MTDAERRRVYLAGWDDACDAIADLMPIPHSIRERRTEMADSDRPRPLAPTTQVPGQLDLLGGDAA